MQRRVYLFHPSPNTQNTMLSLLTLMVFLVRTPLDFTCDELVSVTVWSVETKPLTFAAFASFETLPLMFSTSHVASSIRWLSPVVSRSAATVPWFTLVHHVLLILDVKVGIWVATCWLPRKIQRIWYILCSHQCCRRCWATHSWSSTSIASSGSCRPAWWQVVINCVRTSSPVVCVGSFVLLPATNP